MATSSDREKCHHHRLKTIDYIDYTIDYMLIKMLPTMLTVSLFCYSLHPPLHTNPTKITGETKTPSA